MRLSGGDVCGAGVWDEVENWTLVSGPCMRLCERLSQGAPATARIGYAHLGIPLDLGTGPWRL